MKWVGVMPWIYRPYYLACTATMHPEFKKNVLFIDNTVDNLGIMKSHNMGIDFMRECKADWLVTISAAIRFGESGGLDFIEVLKNHRDLHVINGAGKVMIDGKEQDIAMGWHLTAFKADIFEAIGRWDENFTPYGFDDVDMTLRMKKYFGNVFKMDTFKVDMKHTTRSHSIQLAGVEAPSGPRIEYFVSKWGRHPGAWQWDGWAYPFNDPNNSLAYWPPANNGGKYND